MGFLETLRGLYDKWLSCKSREIHISSISQCDLNVYLLNTCESLGLSCSWDAQLANQSTLVVQNAGDEPKRLTRWSWSIHSYDHYDLCSACVVTFCTTINATECLDRNGFNSKGAMVWPFCSWQRPSANIALRPHSQAAQVAWDGNHGRIEDLKPYINTPLFLYGSRWTEWNHWTSAETIDDVSTHGTRGVERRCYR